MYVDLSLLPWEPGMRLCVPGEEGRAVEQRMARSLCHFLLFLFLSSAPKTQAPFAYGEPKVKRSVCFAGVSGLARYGKTVPPSPDSQKMLSIAS